MGIHPEVCAVGRQESSQGLTSNYRTFCWPNWSGSCWPAGGWASGRHPPLPLPEVTTVTTSSARGSRQRRSEAAARQPTPYEVAVVRQAMDKGHTISTCAGCDGPRIHSKGRRGIRCIGCGQYWNISSWTKVRRCDRCKYPLPVNRRARCLPCALNAHRQRQRREKVRA